MKKFNYKISLYIALVLMVILIINQHPILEVITVAFFLFAFRPKISLIILGIALTLALIFDPFTLMKTLNPYLTLTEQWILYGWFNLLIAGISSLGILARWLVEDKLGFEDSSEIRNATFRGVKI